MGVVKVYITAPYPLIATARLLADALRREAIVVTSRWLDGEEGETSAESAAKDLADVAAADVLVAINPPAWANRGTGGRHVELGYAIALFKPILLLGPRTNIFHDLKTVIVADTQPELIEQIRLAVRPEVRT
jgi:nucleoside 2-deoxyribosyltransferase